MDNVRKYWQQITIGLLVVLVVSVGTVIGISANTKEKEEIQLESFFSVPVHVILPQMNYVKSYRVQTNEKVSLRSMLAFNDIVTFDADKILRVNEYDSNQKLVQSFDLNEQYPFYVRVISKDKDLLAEYGELVQAQTNLNEQYYANNGIEIIIEQQYFNEFEQTNKFMTNRDLQASITAKAITFAESEGYYDEFGNWIEVDSTDDWTVELDDVDIICSANQQLIDGECQTITGGNATQTEDPDYSYDNNDDYTPPVVPKPDPNPSPDPECPEGQELINGTCQSPKPDPDPNPNPDSECPEGQELINGTCQSPKPDPDPNPNPDSECPEGQELIDGTCQSPKPDPDPNPNPGNDADKPSIN